MIVLRRSSMSSSRSGVAGQPGCGLVMLLLVLLVMALHGTEAAKAAAPVAPKTIQKQARVQQLHHSTSSSPARSSKGVAAVAAAAKAAAPAPAAPSQRQPLHQHRHHSSSSTGSLTLNGTCLPAIQDGRETCPLWGCAGELWRPDGLLTDWSFAGYGAGLEAIPSPPVTVDVKKDFGAAGNGLRDDTEAFKAAIEATRATGGVIYVPPGKYILSDQLVLHSYQVLRGAGRDATNLRFTKSMVDLQGWGTNYTAGRGASRFTWQGGMITNNQQAAGVFEPRVNLHLGFVTAPASRGATRLTVGRLVRNAASAALLLRPGEWLTVGLAENAEGDLARMLYNNRTAGGDSLRSFARNFMVSHMSRVVAVGADWVELERPLHVDIPGSVTAVLVKSANHKVTGLGVEDLEVSFPWTAYSGHHEEPGYNAIELVGAISCWVRRVRVTNADSGVRLFASLFNTLSDVQVGTSPWPRRGGRWAGRPGVWQLADMDGHMGIALHWASHDNLVERFNISGTYYHDLLVAAYSSRNVFSQGRGVDICMDHHGAAPSSNLWTDIDVGLGQGAMRWSGDKGSNPFAGRLNTFWGVWGSGLPAQVDYVGALAAHARHGSNNSSSSFRGAAAGAARRSSEGARFALMARPADIQGYQQVVVDMPLDAGMPTIQEAGDWLVHYDPALRVWPPNLYKAMVASASTRLTRVANGTKLSQLFPRPSAGSAAPAAPGQQPQQPQAQAGSGSSGLTARPRDEAITDDPDCLNLGCNGLTGHASWVRPLLTDQVGASEHASESSRLASLVPQRLRGFGSLLLLHGSGSGGGGSANDTHGSSGSGNSTGSGSSSTWLLTRAAHLLGLDGSAEADEAGDGGAGLSVGVASVAGGDAGAGHSDLAHWLQHVASTAAGWLGRLPAGGAGVQRRPAVAEEAAPAAAAAAAARSGREQQQQQQQLRAQLQQMAAAAEQALVLSSSMGMSGEPDDPHQQQHQQHQQHQQQVLMVAEHQR